MRRYTIAWPGDGGGGGAAGGGAAAAPRGRSPRCREAVARAIDEGYNADSSCQVPRRYYFLTCWAGGPGRTPRPDGLHWDRNMMIGGFALLATPAEYGVTGVQTFMVSNEGMVYQQNLGPDSIKLARANRPLQS